MKIMAASFKRPHAHTAIPSAPDPAAGHHRPSPLPETPGHSWTSLGQSLVWRLFIIGDWNAKVGSQEIPGVTGKFGLGVQNEAGQIFAKRTHWSQQALSSSNTRLYTWTSPDGQYQNQTDYVLCSQKCSHSQQKQDQELTVAQIMNSLLPHSDLN